MVSIALRASLISWRDTSVQTPRIRWQHGNWRRCFEYKWFFEQSDIVIIRTTVFLRRDGFEEKKEAILLLSSSDATAIDVLFFDIRMVFRFVGKVLPCDRRYAAEFASVWCTNIISAWLEFTMKVQSAMIDAHVFSSNDLSRACDRFFWTSLVAYFVCEQNAFFDRSWIAHLILERNEFSFYYNLLQFINFKISNIYLYNKYIYICIKIYIFMIIINVHIKWK